MVAPRADGTLDIDAMLERVDKNTILVACMMVNNEIGTRNDVERLAAEVKHRNSRTIVHVDAVQAWMRVPIKLDNIDTLSVSGHKIHAPKGIGALYLSDRLVQAWFSLMGRSQRRKKPTQERFEPLVTAPFVSVASRVAHMLRGMLKGTLCRMGQLFSPQESRSTNVATFLALLELIRAGRVRLDETGTLTMDRARRPRNKQNQPTGKEAAADADHTAQ